MPSEIQTITFSTTLVGGTWSITVDGQTASSIPYNVDTISLESLLEALTTVEDVSILGGGSAFEVIFTDNVDVLEMTVDASLLLRSASTITVQTITAGVSDIVGVQEVQRITIVADGGTWSVNNGNNLAYNAFDGDVEASIEFQTGLGVSVSSSSLVYTITWDSAGPRDQLVVDGTNLTSGGGQGSASIETVTEGVTTVSGVQEVQTITLTDSPTGGTWAVTGGSSLDWDAMASEVESSIESLIGLGVGVTGSDGGPYTVTWDATGDRTQLTGDGSGLTRGGVTVEVVTEQQGGSDFASRDLESRLTTSILKIDRLE